MKRPVPFVIACWMAVASVTAAAPLNRADVSAHPAWALHIDCDALRQTFLGKYLVYQMDKPELNSNMLAFQSFFSFDLRTQLHGLTVYSDDTAPADNIEIIYADLEPERLIKLIQGAGAEAATNGRHVIYSWMDKGKKPDAQKYAVIESKRMVIGNTRESMIAALAVIDGTSPNLSASKALSELGAADDAAFLQVTAHAMDFLGENPNAALLKMAKQLKFQAGETNQQLNAVLTLVVDDENTAKQMSIVAQGAVALLALQKDSPKAARLAGSLAIKQDGGTLTITLSIPSIDLIAAQKEYAGKTEK